MPRYYFHTEDGRSVHDDEGTDLPNDQAARGEAVKVLGQLLAELGEDFWQTENLRVTATDEAGLTLFLIDATALPAPAGSVPYRERRGQA